MVLVLPSSSVMLGRWGSGGGEPSRCTGRPGSQEPHGSSDQGLCGAGGDFLPGSCASEKGDEAEVLCWGENRHKELNHGDRM